MSTIDKRKMLNYKSSCELQADNIYETVLSYGKFKTTNKEEAEIVLQTLKDLDDYIYKLVSNLEFEIDNNNWSINK